MYKLLIVTADKSTLTWTTLPKKIRAIKSALNKTINGSWDVSVVHKDVKPVINSKFRLDHQWYNDFSYPLFREGNHFIFIHFSASQWQKLGLNKGLRGANQIDTDFVGESYGWADEHTNRGKTRHNQFIQTILHEMSHELARTTKPRIGDKTHEWHDANPDISGIFYSYNMDTWQPVYQEGQKEISRLKAILDGLLKKKKLNHFFPLHKTRVSQPYGVRNQVMYPMTKHHIGTDFATPVGTPIIAPTNCRTTRVGYSAKSLGHWCEVLIEGKYYIFAHLEKQPPVGLLLKGWVIGFTGNTGMSTGPHCHVEGWHKPMDRAALTEQNFRELTFDITTVIQ